MNNRINKKEDGVGGENEEAKHGETKEKRVTRNIGQAIRWHGHKYIMSLTICVTLGKSLAMFIPQFSDLLKRNNKIQLFHVHLKQYNIVYQYYFIKK